jgi:Tfp pilus assembly protein FimT
MSNPKSTGLKVGNLTACPAEPWRSGGFTLVEIMVTIGLLVLMLTLSTISYRNATKRTELILTAQEVASNLRLAQTYAASAKSPDADQAHNVWGLYFDKANPNRIIMFVDKNRNGLYDADNNESYKVIALPSQVKMSKLFSSKDKIDQELDGPLAITFVPPDPKVRFCQIGADGKCGDSNTTGDSWSENWDSVRVVLLNQLDDSVKIIEINFFGLIDVPQIIGAL